MTSSPSMQAAKIDFNPLKSFALSATMKNMSEQNKNLQAQNFLINSQESVAFENARRQRLENNYFEKYGQWPSKEGGLVVNAKSLLNYFPELYGIISREIPGTSANREYQDSKLRSVGDYYR